MRYAVSLLLVRGEEGFADVRDRLLVDEHHAVVERLRAHDSVLLSEHDESAEAGFVRGIRVPAREETGLVNFNFTGKVVLSLELDNLAQHFALVFFDSVVFNALNKREVLLATTQHNLWLNHLDQTLHEQLVQKVFINALVLNLFGQSLFSVLLQAFNQLVCFAHLVDPDSIEVLGALDLIINTRLLQISSVLVVKLDALLLNDLLLATGNLVLAAVFNGLDLGFLLSLDILLHNVADLAWSTHILIFN